jgi:response regulator RpfG family c-di-GMP phosphodiesterase
MLVATESTQLGDLTRQEPGLMASVCSTAQRVRLTTVAVVDSRPEDYAAPSRDKPWLGMTWRFLLSGREALRMAAKTAVDLWVVNAVLPDMSGSDLCSMLHSRQPLTTVYVVADFYRDEDERAARLCGASLFVCKPVQVSWFDLPLRQKETMLTCE